MIEEAEISRRGEQTPIVVSSVSPPTSLHLYRMRCPHRKCTEDTVTKAPGFWPRTESGNVRAFRQTSESIKRDVLEYNSMKFLYELPGLPLNMDLILNTKPKEQASVQIPDWPPRGAVTGHI